MTAVMYKYEDCRPIDQAFYLCDISVSWCISGKVARRVGDTIGLSSVSLSFTVLCGVRPSGTSSLIAAATDLISASVPPADNRHNTSLYLHSLQISLANIFMFILCHFFICSGLN